MKLVKALFPEADSYTDVYHKHNLLTDKVGQVTAKDRTMIGKYAWVGIISIFYIFNYDNSVDLQTVMAHGCYLSDEELALFRETGASLSHCPNSNIS